MTALFNAKQFEQEIQSASNPLGIFRDAIKNGNEILKQRFAAGDDVAVLVHERSLLIDQLLQHAWNKFFSGNDTNISLIAVGGYGRAELHPGSDIDLMILLRNTDQEDLNEKIEQFLMFLWDIGLEVGHSVRSLQECVDEASQDITIATNLMEARPLCGPEDLFETMREETGPSHLWPSKDFFEAKWKEQQQRYRKFDDTAYKLEPNVKEGPGGLRDIQMIGWVVKRHFDADTLHDLVTHQFLTESEYEQLIDGQKFLWKVRFALHFLTGRREDRLLFDYQKTIATQFGYSDGKHNLAVEQFMQRYYKTIMSLARLNEMLLQLFQEAILFADDSTEPVKINRRFQSIKGFLDVTHEKVFQYHSFALLEIFLLLEMHPELKGVRASTIRLIRNNRHLINKEFRNDLRAKSLFMEILKQPHGVTHELRRMNRYGILAAYLPAFAKIVGRMQYDLFHELTVDEHTLFVVRNIRRFTVPEFSNEFPLCSQLIHEIPKQELLILAGLFHDIAKGRGGDHSELGAVDAINFCLAHGLSDYDASLVAWLVRNHLLMSSTAQRKDISDPDVINEFGEKIVDINHLNYIYLLTVADIRATNQTLWNSWKDSLLKELYHSTRKLLTKDSEETLDQKELIQETQQEAKSLLLESALPEEEISSVWNGFDDEYFLRYNAEEINWLTKAISECKEDDLPLVLVEEDVSRGSTAISIYSHPQEHQFAITTAALEQMGLNVVDARIQTNQDNRRLSTFLVLEENGDLISSPLRRDEIRQSLRKKLTETQNQISVSRRLPRQHKHFDIDTKIEFNFDPHSQRTMLEVHTGDRPGLLSRIGQAFRECNINLHSARITTIGARIEDVFYITDMNDEPLDDPRKQGELKKTILELLSE